MAVHVIFADNDNVIEVTDLKNLVDGAFQNAATVTVTITDSDGNEVAGETWPLTLPYVSGSEGDYRANLADTISFVATNEYTADVIADAGANGRARWPDEEVIARTRKSN